MLKVIGLMSGTSMDGIDAALVETDGKFSIKTLTSLSLDYQKEFQILLKIAEFIVGKSNGDLSLAKNKFIEYTNFYPNFLKLKDSLYNYLRQEISLENIINHSTSMHLDIVNDLIDKSGLARDEIDLIAYHGQTLYHSPELKISIQIGNGKYLAEKTTIKVINNFRENDIKNGGQGAPLAPIYHLALASKHDIFPIVIVNCGGIANITYIPSKNEHEMIGFDSGPGNVLIDRYIRLKTNGLETYDKDGKYGLKGNVNNDVLQKLFDKAVRKQDVNFLKIKAPKSLDSSNFYLIDELDSLSLEDAIATLEVFTAITIANAINEISAKKIPKKIVLAGGGWNNPVITNKFKECFKDLVEVVFASQIGYDSRYMEAELCSYIGARSYQNLPITYPSTTGVLFPCIGGVLHD